MKLFRKKKNTDKGKRVSFTQGNLVNPSYSTIIVDGEIIDPKEVNKRQKEYDWLVDSGKTNPKKIKSGKYGKFRLRYKPNELFAVDFNSKNVLDNSNRTAPIQHKSTKKEPIKKVYRDFLKETEKLIKTANLSGDGTIDKELREAIKKEIRKQHKIHNIKKVSKIAIPTSLAIAGGAYLYNKNKKKKKDN